jgi:hypothetical protein
MWIIPENSPSGILIRTNHRDSNPERMVAKNIQVKIIQDIN